MKIYNKIIARALVSGVLASSLMSSYVLAGLFLGRKRFELSLFFFLLGIVLQISRNYILNREVRKNDNQR